MAEQSGATTAPPPFLATADVQQVQLPVREAAQQQQGQPHKKKAQGKKRKRARRALRLSLRPEVDAVLPALARLRDDHAATPELVARAAEDHFGGAVAGSAEIEWAAVPSQLNPLAGKVPPARAERKRRQIESLLHWACRLLPPPTVSAAVKSSPVVPAPVNVYVGVSVCLVYVLHTFCPKQVVDFCAGGGHLGLVLAALRPDITMVLLDVRQPALDGAQQRAAAMGLSNVQTFCGSVAEYRAPFDLALALHSCGGAADAVQAAAIAAGAAFVIAPCCYGFIQAAAEQHGNQSSARAEDGAATLAVKSTDAKLLLVADLQYPRSAAYRSVDALSATVYAAIAGSADATYWPEDSRAGEHDVLARDCMDAIDRDRTLLAVEAGYAAAFTTMDAAASEVRIKKTGEGETVGGQENSQHIGSGDRGGGHGSGLKNQLLVGWRLPLARTETTTEER